MKKTHLNYLKTLVIFVSLMTATGFAQNAPAAPAANALPLPSPDWKIIHTAYPTEDLVVAGLNVLDFGAKADGQTDCTAAFQAALNRMGEAGGGTVFAPAGRYVFTTNLYIPVSVTLRGEWQAPTADDWTTKGTVLMPLAGRNSEDGPPFIMVDYCGGVKDLTIWYPEQSSVSPIPYPFCLEQKGGDNATFENLTLVNPYQGIRIGPGANELHYVHNVYGTPLRTGIWYDTTTDIGRLENVRFSPEYWRKSGLPGTAPEGSDSLTRWIKANGVAFHMLRSDWEYVANVEAEGYYRGFLMTQGAKGVANAQFYRLTLRNCTVAMEVEEVNAFGMTFTQCLFDGIETGVLLSERFKSAILFSECTLNGKDALVSSGTGNVLIETCLIERGNILLNGGTCSLVDLTLRDPDARIEVQDYVLGVAVAGNDYDALDHAINNHGAPDLIKTSENKITLSPVPVYPERTRRTYKPARAGLEVLHPGAENDAVNIQQAMDRMAEAGGGIVLLTAGDYLIRKPLNVPTGVELRGIHDVPHHTMGGGSILHIYPSKNDPAVTLQASCGLRGLSFNYPEQVLPNPNPYPFLLQGRGSDLYIINVNASNPYEFLDLRTHPCDNHFVDYLSGSPIKTGIAIGGKSKNGLVQNMQFNPHYARRLPRETRMFKDPGTIIWEYQKENLDALVVGDCYNQFLYQNFVFGSLYGIHFTKERGDGAINCISHGHGTDGSKVSAFFEHGNGTITLINNELVAMSSRDKTAIKMDPDFTDKTLLINTMVWGSPELLAEIEGGTLILQNLHANHHGKGIHIGEGELMAVNLNFAERRTHLKMTAQKSKASFSGVITTGPFEAETRKGRLKTDLMISR